MSNRITADLRVDQFGVTIDETTRRLDFPRAEADGLEGASGSTRYGAKELVFDKLHTRLDRVHWAAEAASAGPIWMRTDDGGVELTIQRAEMPRGIMVTHAAGGGVEILAQHATLTDLRLALPHLGEIEAPSGAALVRPADVPLRQGRLRFLDGMSGEIRFTITVELDLPVIGKRTLDQKLRIPVADGSLDFRALEDNLNWLEGAFLDVGVEERRLAVKWGVPLIAPGARQIISWELDDDAYALATFDRVPLRSLADFRLPETPPDPEGKRKSRVRKLSLVDLDVQLSLRAPRNLEVAGGTIMFGGDDAPGIVDLKVAGGMTHPPAPGDLRGTIGLVDVTTKDVNLGPMKMTVDRLHLGAIETLQLVFDGFRPVGLTCAIPRATATNLSLAIAPSPPAT